jgi:hypothetical protein
MQSLIMRINWNYYLLPMEALPLLNEICEVKEKRVGSVRKFYVDKETTELDLLIEVVQAGNIVYKSEEGIIIKDYDTIIKEANDSADYYRKAYLDMSNKVKELEAKLASATEDTTCPS